MFKIMDWLARSCRLVVVTGALGMLATTAYGAECTSAFVNGGEFALCRSIASAHAQSR